MLKKVHPILYILLGMLAFTSCSTTKSLEEGQYLLIKNKIEFDSVNPGIDTDEMYAILQPRPNKKFLGIVPVRPWLYHWGTGGKPESKFRRWLREKVGSKPVIYEQGAAENSVTGLENYMDKIGYFNSGAEYELFTHKNKARVKYTVTPATPYRVRNITYNIKDPILDSIIQQNPEMSGIKPGMIFSSFKLDDERERLTANLQNNGYFYFDRNYIYFIIDSSLMNYELDVEIQVKDYERPASADSLQTGHFSHFRYRINDVLITTNYNDFLQKPEESGKAPDTLLFLVEQDNGDSPPAVYHFIYRDKLKVHPLTITQSIFIRPGDIFSAKDVRMSKLRLSEIGVYNYTNLRFRELGIPDSLGIGLLDCNIDLGRRKLHSFVIEAEGTNRGGKPGVGLSFAYQNSNIFRGSELLQFKTHISLEAQENLASGGDDVTGDIPFFNTIETGFEVSVTFPRFLAPIRQQRFSKYFRPKTSIRVGIGYERRPEYTRNPIYLSFGYTWKESEHKRHMINPFDWNIVKVDLSPDFADEIAGEPNDRIRNQYTDHIITALSYRFIFNNQDINKLKNFIYLIGDVETAGNLPYLYHSAFGTIPDTLNYYSIAGIRYSQYGRISTDLRFYNVITRNTSLVYRFFAGVGIPYGNAEVLPLEKGFYGGGANGMRGWTLRRLGPGSYYNPEDNYDKMGDIQLEANIEYRFPVYKFFKLGLFIDVGNVWLLQENESYPGGEFRMDKFFKDFAIDAGLGLRLDFNFFILRVDAAIPIHDPAIPGSSKWTFGKWQFSDVLINFGIGYPF